MPATFSVYSRLVRGKGMMKVRSAVLFAAAAIVCASPAFGQQSGPPPRKLEFRKWDFGGSLGILGANRTSYGLSETTGTGGYNFGDQFTWAANIDAGRYFTTHLKADAGLMWSSERSFYKSTYTGAGPYSTSFGTVHPLSISGAMTYQFFENVFAHPYVSVGVRVTSFDEDIQTYTSSGNVQPPYLPPTLTSTPRRYEEAEPFIAAGYKSYFNERAYMRSDFLIAFDKNGFSHGTLRLGLGIDF